MGNPVAWFEIYVQDMARARRFYETVFGVALTRLESPASEVQSLEMWAFPMDNAQYGATGSLVRMPGMPSGGNSVLVYFHCEDCAVEAAKAAQAGGRVERAKTSLGQYGHMALVVDPDGNLIGLHSMR